MYGAFIGPGAFPHSKAPGIIVTSQVESALFRGWAFTQSDAFTLSSAQVINFLIDPSGYIPDDEQIYGKIIFEVPVFSATGGPVLIEFFIDPVFTAPGTILSPPPFNRHLDNARTAYLSITQGPTLVSPGTLLSQIVLPATATGINGTPASTIEALPLILGTTPTLLMRITNEDGNGVRLGIRHNWYEV